MAVVQTYQCTTQDVNDIQALGYTFHGILANDFAGFMQQNFPGFDIARLLKQVDQVMVPHAGGPVMRDITVTGKDLEIILENDHGGVEDKALIFNRKFFKEKRKLKVSHEYLVFPISARGQKLNNRVQIASLEQYKNMGIGVIEITAGLSAGGYVWARHGFVAVNKTEMQDILDRASKRLTQDQYDIVKIIYDKYYKAHPKGKAFPISRWANLPYMKGVLIGTQWQGRLDLKNPEQLRKFEDYVFQ